MFQACLNLPTSLDERLPKQRFGLGVAYKHYGIQPSLELLGLDISNYGAFENPSHEEQAEFLFHLKYRPKLPQ